MRKISVENIKLGMTAARPVYGGGGQKLINQGARLKPHYAHYLKQLGINYIYIEDKRLEGIEVEDVIADETRIEARSLVKEIMQDARSRNGNKSLCIKDDKVVETAQKIIDELLSQKEVMVNLIDIRAADDYTFAHCVNACVLSILTALKMNYKEKTLQQVAVGFLLHDLGNVVLPAEILKKPGPLSEEEFEVIKKHPIYGYEMLKNSSLFSATAGSIVYQHHERESGQGYPKGLKKDQIHYLAKVVAVADVYDALTSDRPYRRAYQPHQAIEILTAMGEEHFDLEILRTFLSFIAAYPVGSHVLLSNSESGLVVGNTPGFPNRPRVRILYEGESMAPHPNPYEVDLTEVLDLTITKVLD